MIRRLVLLRRVTYARYLGASAGSLGVDIGLFLLLLAAHASAALASGIGYAAGVAAHWWLSSRAVFTDRVAEMGGARLTQQALFLASAGIGLALTVGVVGLGAALGLDPRIAKLGAIALSFQTVWLLRRHVVFGR